MSKSKYKEISSNWERRLLAIIDNSRDGMDFGSISISLRVRNKKVVAVDIKDITKSFNLGND